MVGASFFCVNSLMKNFNDKTQFCKENLIVQYSMTKSFFHSIKFIISDEIIVVDKKKKTLNLTFIVVNTTFLKKFIRVMERLNEKKWRKKKREMNVYFSFMVV